jgi:hypothetical protein
MAYGIGVVVVVYCLIHYYRHTPSPGKAVAVLGVAAVIMAARGDEMGHPEKVMWMSLVFALLFVEIRALNNDKLESEKRQAATLREERQHFSEVGDGIKAAMRTGQQQFQQTLSDNQTKFAAVMDRTQNILRSTEKTADTASHAVEALTGGKSYPLAGISYNLQDMSHLGLYGLFAGKRETDAGSFRYDVSKMEPTHFRPFEPGGVCFLPYFKEIGETFSGDSSAIYQVPAQLWNVTLVPSKDGLVNHYKINMRTNTNGQFVECLDIRASSCLGKFHWDARTTVWRSDSFVVYTQDWPKCN